MPESITLVERHPLFTKDLKRLTKKYKTLPVDLDLFQKALLLAHGKNADIKPESMGFFPLSGRGFDGLGLFIGKRFACRSIPGGSNSGIRIVYRIDVDCCSLLYIEVFHKNEKPTPDFDRIISLLADDA